MKEWIKIAFFVLLLALVMAANYFLKEEKEVVVIEYSKCNLSKGECNLFAGNEIIRVSVVGEIKALQKFEIRLSGQSDNVLGARVNFKMKTMDMGINQYTFVKHEDGVWLAEVVIPICTAGRRDWLVELELSLKSGQKKVVFDLVI